MFFVGGVACLKNCYHSHWRLLFQFLTMEQSGMTHVIDTIQSDLSDLKRIKDGMMRILQGHI